MSQPSHSHLVIGRLGRSHGVKGWMRVQSFTDPSDQLLSYKSWVFDDTKADVPVESSQQKNKHLFIKIKDCDTPEVVRERFTNRLICIKKTQLDRLSDGDGHYWHELMGCQVVNLNQTSLGTIDHLFSTPGNDVAVVQGKSCKHLIPWTKNAVHHVNLEQRTVQVDWDPDF